MFFSETFYFNYLDMLYKCFPTNHELFYNSSCKKVGCYTLTSTMDKDVKKGRI